MKKYSNLKGIQKKSDFNNSIIYLIRHGECLSNIGKDVLTEKEDVLTEKGEQQAIKCGEFINDYFVFDTPVKIYTSAMQRAKQTGELIGKKINCDISFSDDRLNEISHCSRDNENSGDLNYKNVFERLDEVIKEIWEENKNRTNIIVTHQGVLELLLCRAISNYYTGFELPIINNREDEVYYEIHSNTGISSFRLNESGKIKGLITWNLNIHLNSI